ncbi:MAG TPA: hypothetical protein VHZ55_02900 [Bryobacteraceae bacterium]|nr:hypothetical protein [Bryobacteraceae bacterium]
MTTDLLLNSVNFEHGMLLSPEHFLRQERYFDSVMLWAIRYATACHGLVGAGPRAWANDAGSIQFDPQITLKDEGDFLHVAVSNCRGITPAGCIVDLGLDGIIASRFSKTDLEGTTITTIYLLAYPHAKEVIDGATDTLNPQMQTERRPAYELYLQVAPHLIPYSLAVGRIRKSETGSGHKRDSLYIPPCTTMSAHSGLLANWRQINDEVSQLEERYIELYRAMQEFVILFKERGIETGIDEESLQLVRRLIAQLRACIYEILDPFAQPDRFFTALRQFFQSAALDLDLSPQVQGFFETLRDAGETTFVSVLETQRRIAKGSPAQRVNEDLAVEARTALSRLADLRQLERALEGKYLDFRVNHFLEAMNFIFDRGGKVLYRLAAKPNVVQGAGDELIITFSQVRLEGRDRYRLVLVGEHGSAFELDNRIPIDIRLNEGSGFRRDPILLSTQVQLYDQCNFEFDFEAPDVPIITDLRALVPSHLPFRTALLFVRQRFYSDALEESRPASAKNNQALLGSAPTPGSPRREAAFADRAPASRMQDRMQEMRPAPPRQERPSEEPAPPFSSPFRRRRLE